MLGSVGPKHARTVTVAARCRRRWHCEAMTEGPRIYNLFPLIAGSIAEWKKHLRRISAMGFNWVYVNPFHYSGFSGSLYAVKDYYRLNPIFRGHSRRSDETLLRDFVETTDRHGLAVMMDLVVNHTSKDSALAEEHPDWFVREPDGALRSPRAVDPDDAKKVTVWGDLAEIDYTDRAARADVVAYWCALARYYAGLGIRGFRCDAAYKVPPAVWKPIVDAAREARPDARFFAETLGCQLEEVLQLRPAGFDFLFNSARWWDFRAPWLLEQYEAFRHIAPSVAFPESHDTERLAAELARSGLTAPADVEACYRQRYVFAAAFSTGVMMPIGYEFGWRRKLDVVRTRPSDQEEPAFDLSEFIAGVNEMKRSTPAFNEEGPQRVLDLGADCALALLRRTADGKHSALNIFNVDPARPCRISQDRLAEVLVSAGVDEVATPGGASSKASPHVPNRLAPFEARVIRSAASGASARAVSDKTGRESDSWAVAARSRPIIIQNVYPEIDSGRYPVKREVGDTLEVWADIFREGHERTAAVLRYRRADAAEWRETPMELVEPGLDRWCGKITLRDNARYVYTIEAWPDSYESWREELEKKNAAGQDVSLELHEGRALIVAAFERAEGSDRRHLEQILADADSAASGEDLAAIMTSTALQQIMARWPDRSLSICYDRVLEAVVDRERARFAAWYEMFPRSQGREPGKGGTFEDCRRRLPDIAAMGFDVIYFVPIHPIGRTHRKGPNNVVEAGPDDPGSPYAIGSAEGGHTAIHPELGTLADFRRFVEAAHDHGIEVALDFAIQCSPDHPWIAEHPEWFRFRPDGSIKHAENPPKKYQDIVNVNFFGPHRDALWRALRDVVLFWIDRGVKTFRVDNPHTKPFPFWEWLIRDVQTRHPDAIFLSEAFTRPRVVELLAKAGFSQSYTYFTWRNFKGEITDYLTELTQTPVREFLRPNFFTNTPDILPQFLQTGGRPAFLIRLVLAATLSSLYGICNGFELCENTAVPGTEEYADSEKYQYKVRDWDRPGHIKDEIARINTIRRENPALHELDNLRFHPASNDNVLFYSKMSRERDNMIFVVVNLDPFEPQVSEIAFPLAEMGIPADENFEVEELIGGAHHLWRGERQRIRLEPAHNPAEIFRITPWTRIDYREPCF